MFQPDPLAPAIAAVATAWPPHRYEQDELIAAFKANWATVHHNVERVDQLHRSVRVGGRNLALPMERYPALSGFGEANSAWIEVGTAVGEAAVRGAIEKAGLVPTDIDAIFFTTVTGVAAPSIDARLVNRLRMCTDIKRSPFFGLGCVAGAAGVARVSDYLRAYPTHATVLLSVELCSLTLQRGDLSIPNLIASGLFGDGAAAVVMVGAERARAMGIEGPRVAATKSRFYYDTERVMGWDVGDRGFKIVLSATVPDVVRRYIGEDVDGFLAEQGLSRADVASWVCHPGGPKVLEAFQDVLGLPEDALSLTWESLELVGNLSSASVLHVLGETLARRRPPPGTPGLMMAMGPAFCSELVLLSW